MNQNSASHVPQEIPRSSGAGETQQQQQQQQQEQPPQQQRATGTSVVGVALQAIPRPRSQMVAEGQATLAGGAKVMAERYKTNICKNFIEHGYCSYEDRCMFAHGEHELRTVEMNFRDGIISEDAIRHYKRVEAYRLQAQQAAMEAEFGAPPGYDDTKPAPPAGGTESNPGAPVGIQVPKRPTVTVGRNNNTPLVAATSPSMYAGSHLYQASRRDFPTAVPPPSGHSHPGMPAPASNAANSPQQQRSYSDSNTVSVVVGNNNMQQQQQQQQQQPNLGGSTNTNSNKFGNSSSTLTNNTGGGGGLTDYDYSEDDTALQQQSQSPQMQQNDPYYYNYPNSYYNNNNGGYGEDQQEGDLDQDDEDEDAEVGLTDMFGHPLCYGKMYERRPDRSDVEP